MLSNPRLLRTVFSAFDDMNVSQLDAVLRDASSMFSKLRSTSKSRFYWGMFWILCDVNLLEFSYS